MITKEQALTCNHFEHILLKNTDGTPVRARRNGRTKIWKTRPGEFHVPVKYGMYEYFYIAPRNANEWNAA